MVVPADQQSLHLVKGVEIEPDRLEGAIDTERRVLGHLLAAPEMAAECAALAPDHFVIDEFRRVFAAIRDIGPGFTPRAVHERSGVPYPIILSAIAGAVGGSIIALPDYVSELRRAAIIRTMRDSAVKIAAQGAGGDPAAIAEVLRRAAAQADAMVTTQADYDADGLARVLSEHLDLVRSGASPLAVTTGLTSLDEIVGGFRDGELWIVAARPGMGKTVLMVTSARATAAATTYSVGLISLEVGKVQFSARLHADHIRATAGAAVPFGVFMRGALHRETEELLARAASEIGELGLHTMFRDRIDIVGVEATIERWKMAAERRGRPLRAVWIDYLKFIDAGDRYKGNRVLEIGETTQALRQIAKRQGVCIVLLCQLNRGVESRDDKRPRLSDLRDSGAIEEDADLVMMLFREAYYLSKARSAEDLARLDMVQHEVEILIEKNRAGAVGTVNLWCDVATSSMRDRQGDA